MPPSSPISAGFERSNSISPVVECQQSLSFSSLFPTSPQTFSSRSEIRSRDGADERESAGVEAPDPVFQIIESPRSFSLSWLFPTATHTVSISSPIQSWEGYQRPRKRRRRPPQSRFPNRRVSTTSLPFLILPYLLASPFKLQPNSIMGRAQTDPLATPIFSAVVPDPIFCILAAVCSICMLNNRLHFAFYYSERAESGKRAYQDCKIKRWVTTTRKILHDTGSSERESPVWRRQRVTAATGAAGQKRGAVGAGAAAASLFGMNGQ